MPWVVETPQSTLLFALPTSLHRDWLAVYDPYTFWSFDDTGATVADRGRAGMSLTYGANALKQQVGAIVGDGGTSAGATSPNTVASTTASWVPTTGVWSCAAWFKLSALGGVSQIINGRAAGVGGFEIRVASGIVSVVASDAGSNSTAADTTPVSAGTWHHAAAVFDGYSLLLLVNGSLRARVQATFATTTQSGITVGVPAASTTMHVDEVATWDEALPASAVQALYRFGSIRSTGAQMMLTEAPSSGADAQRQVDALPREDGGFVGDAYAGTRVWTLTGVLRASSQGQVQRSAQAVRGSTAQLMRATGRLRWRPDGFDALSVVVRRWEEASISALAPLARRCVTSFVAPDARVYSARLLVHRIQPSRVGGFTAPLTGPVKETVNLTPGVLVNDGDAASPPVWRLRGPFTRALLRNDRTGESFVVAATVEDGEVLTIDTARRELYLGTTLTAASNRYAALEVGARLWRLDPGSTPVTFVARDAGANTQARVEYRHAWMP